MARPLACRLGFHRYRWVGPPPPRGKNSYRACARCGTRRRLFDLGATEYDYRGRMGLDDPPDRDKR